MSKTRRKIAAAAGADAANRQMRAAGRTRWNRADFDLAAETYRDLLRMDGLLDDKDEPAPWYFVEYEG